jgi:hypothetical protein
VQWRDGHTTILPCVLKDGVNICEANDVRFVEYLAQLPQSTSASKRVVHIEHDSTDRNQLLKLIASALSTGKPVVIRCATTPPVHEELTVQYLETFGISRNMAVTVHGGVPLFAVKLLTNSIGTRCRSTCKHLPVSSQVRDHTTIHSGHRKPHEDTVHPRLASGPHGSAKGLLVSSYAIRYDNRL